MVAPRMRRQSTYGPVFEDWLFHVWLPAAAYLSLASSAVVASGHGRESLFSVGGAVLLLLFVGIHNAWDAVAYHALVGNLDSSKEQSGAGVDASSALN